MTHSAPDTAPADLRPGWGSWLGVLLPVLCFLVAMTMSADFIAVSLLPLKALRIPYSPLLDYAPLLIPGACLVLWVVLRRAWPVAGAVVAVGLCVGLVSLIPHYAEGRVARVPVRHELQREAVKAMEGRMGFAIVEQGSGEGAVVLVSSSHEPALRAELDRLGLLSGRGRRAK